MKHILILTILWVLGVSSVAAQEQILSYQITGVVNLDRSIVVEEEVVYDFGEAERQGIFRVIPLDGIGDLELVSVELNGDPVNYVVEDESPFTVRIGTEGEFLTGQQEYRLEYQLIDAVPYFSRQDIDEMYWNLLGNQWEVPVWNFVGTLVYPESVAAGITGIECYVGEYGSSERCEYAQEELEIQVAAQNLGVGEGLTLAVGVEPGIFEYPGIIAQYRHWIDLGGALVLFIILSGTAYLWWNRFGRDIPVKRPLVREFEPPQGYLPAEVGRIKHMYPRSSHIAGLIIDLARRGYLSIEEKKKGLWGKQFTLRKERERDDQMKDYEQWLYTKLFAGRTLVSTSDLQKEDFGSDVQKLYSKIYDQELADIFVRKPGILVGVGVVIGALIAMVAIFSLIGGWIGIGIVCILCSLLWFVVATLMPKRTVMGAEIYQHVLGFEYYMQVAEKHRMEFQEREQIFFELLPYAISLGIVTKWAKAFDDIDLEAPDWYRGDIQAFSAATFASQLSSNMSSFMVQSGGAGSSGSSGGGFSGGGVGGGGGGSW